MVTLIEGIGWGLMLLAGIGYAGIAARTHRHQEFPGKPSFVAACLLMAGLLSALAVLFPITRLDHESPLITTVGWIVQFGAFVTGGLAPLVWVRFALLFTGQRVPTDRRTFVRIGLPVIMGLTAVAILTAIPLLSFAIGQQVLPPQYVPFVVGSVEYLIAFTAFYLAALLVVGASLVGWTSYTYRHLSTAGGALLGIGFLLPWIAIVMPRITDFFQNQPVLLTYHVVGGGVVGVVGLGSAVYRHELFENVPAAGTVGRAVTVEEMSDPVVVIDADHRILDINAAAEGVLDVSVGTIGSSLSTVFDGAVAVEDLLAESTGDIEFTRNQRTYAVTASELHDEYGRTLGYSIVLHDVTDRKQREQRIEVLNRVLRHNLRNDLNTVNGYAELLEGELSDPSDYLGRIQERASELIATGEKAREIEEVVASHHESRTTDVADVIDQAVGEVESSCPDCAIRVEPVGTGIPVNAPVLTSVLRELIENGCKHTDAETPRVELDPTVTEGEYPLTIRVTDNGPGIPEHELTPLKEGTETALEHGSGLGLWLINWGVETLNGQIDFETTDTGGTIATLRLPAAA